jgi:Protein of unknown function (DUF3352)
MSAPTAGQPGSEPASSNLTETQTGTHPQPQPPIAPPPPTPPLVQPPAPWQPAGMSGQPAGLQPAAPAWAPGIPPTQPHRGGGRGRWIVALLVTVIVAIAAIGIAVFAVGGQNSVAIGPTFLPASAPLYGEIRLDLPGDQRDNLIKLVSHFPGFADQAAFDTKIDQTFDTWLGNASGDRVDYTTDIKPWFSGQVGLGLLQMPSASAAGTPRTASLVGTGLGSSASDAHTVVGFGVKDRGRLDTELLAIKALASGVTFQDAAYGDDTITTVQSGGAVMAAYAETDTLLLVATGPDDLKASLDVLRGKTASLASDPGFSAAMKDLPADRLGAVYAGGAAFAALTTAGSLMPDPSALPGLADCGPTSMPDLSSTTLAAAIVAQGDHLALETRVGAATETAAPQAPDVADHVPPAALVYFQARDVGAALHSAIACMKSALADAMPAGTLDQVESALGAKLEDYLSFVGDVAVGAWSDGSKLQVGLVASVSDEALATQRIAQLVGIIRLAAGAGGLPVTVSDAQANGVDVTTISVAPPPDFGSVGIDTSVSISVAGGHMYLGTGDFAATAPAIRTAASLGSDQRYTSALSAAGPSNGSVLYADIDAIRQLAESTAFTPNADYTTNIEPYLAPFDRLIATGNAGAGSAGGQILLFVK